MPHPFPHHYEVELSWKQERQGVLRSQTKPEIVGGPPAEFDGREDWWSPEHLLLSAAALCLMNTFTVIAKKAQLSFSSYKSHIKGVLEKTEAGIVFTSIQLGVDLVVATGEREKAEKNLTTAKKHCIISNALNVPVELKMNVVEA